MRSRNSTQRGMMPSARMALTARPTDSSSARNTSSVLTASGLGTSRSVASVTMPSVPSLPTMSAVRS
ncbi:MAG: hypothetical protein IPH72_26590 [Sandaracinaceae bacterium]|nr:hypothetical protein [Sandaracinaceae bacterium]